MEEECDDCPLHNMNGCMSILPERALCYITEKEPAPSANDTSSVVKTLHLDDNTKAVICQEAEKACKACEMILDIYERMEYEEQKAFDLGQAYQAMLEVKKELARLGKV